MKLVKQVQLYYTEGTSDKVYEVDLCEVGDGEFVVNFRYGRRGAELRDGSKTPLSVNREKAEDIFEKLVQSKTKKGYEEAGSPSRRSTSSPSRSAPAPAVDVPETADPRHGGLLQRLAQGVGADSNWKLERAIWRAGELAVPEALPYLTSLAGAGTALRNYCTAFALGRCARAALDKTNQGAGDFTKDAEEAVAVLRKFAQGNAKADFVRRMAVEALFFIAPPAERERLRDEVLDDLPNELRDQARKGPAEQLTEALKAYLKDAKYPEFEVLEKLYLIDNEITRPALLALLTSAKLKPNYFQRIRHIYKAAEFRGDADFFGLLAHRFEKVRANYDNRGWSSYAFVNGSYTEITQKKQAKPDTKLAYGARTRSYLRKRSWRTLRRLGELDSPGYARMAAAVLLRVTDDDAGKKRTHSTYRYERGRYREVKIHYDEFSNLHVFNSILYANSSRYQAGPTLNWKCKGDYKPGKPAPAEREEAFPKLWDKSPEVLTDLLLESRCKRVHGFAARALRENTEYLDSMSADLIARLLKRPYKTTAKLAFELAQKRYDPSSPNLTLIAAAATSSYDKARETAFGWLDKVRADVLADAGILFELTVCEHQDTAEKTREILLSADLTENVARDFIARVVAHMLGMDAKQGELAKRMGETLLRGCARPLRGLGMEIIADLLGSKIKEVQEFAGHVLLEHDQMPSEAVIMGLMDSPHDNVRTVGVRLLGRFTDDMLLERGELLVGLARHKLPDMRNAARPIITRIAAAKPEFAERLVDEMINVLTRNAGEDLHNDVLKLTREDLSDAFARIASQRGAPLVWRLLNSKYAPAWDLGGVALARLEPDALTTPQIVKLSNHEIKSVREATWELYRKLIPRLKTEMPAAVKMLEGDWDDTRDFAFDFFRRNFADEDYSPETLVSICDSTVPRVQQFGREMITKFFTEDQGELYLMKLSEHPTAEMQGFVTNFLERYAVDQPERLVKLLPYFIGVFSLVNKARLAKSRILDFLEKEAVKDKAAAELVAKIMTRLSAVIAVGDRARSIEIMLAIRNKFPDIPLPIQRIAFDRHPAFVGED